MRSANVLLLTYGTRGDVEPFVALALRLKERGHSVTLATAAQFEEWITSFGVDFAPLSNDSLDLIHSDDGKAMLAGDSGIAKRIAAGTRLSRKSGPINAALCSDAWRAAREIKPNLIVFHPKVIAGAHIAEALGVPAILAVLQPMIVPTSEFPATGLPRLPIPGYNRLTYRLVAMSFATYRKSINAFRIREIDLEPIRRAKDVLMPTGAGHIPVLHAISPHVVPRPEDWPQNAYMTGYWTLPEDASYVPPETLAEFLATGEPLVYVGFGSMTTRDPKSLGSLVVGALARAGVRGVLGSGWAKLSTQSTAVITIGDVPHSWLFPRMAAVVHHGGAGTTAAGLRAGVPTVICPFFGDQPGWAERTVALGVGAPPVPRKRLTPETLATSIAEAVCNPSIKLRAKDLSDRLHREDGVGAAIMQIEESLK